MTRVLFLLVLLTVSALSVSAQEQPQSSCKCKVGDGGCAASQSCPDGYLAVCSCSAFGCSSQCLAFGGDGRPGGLNEDEIGAAISKNDAKVLSLALSKFYRRFINFSPMDSTSQIPRPRSISPSPVDWTLLEFLDKNGHLTINGQPLSFWNGMRQTLLSGGAYQICSSRADAVLNEISFVAGRSYSVAAGKAQARLDAPVKGNGLPELLLNLSRAANIRIQEN